jgi:hypothetical protein
VFVRKTEGAINADCEADWNAGRMEGKCEVGWHFIFLERSEFHQARRLGPAEVYVIGNHVEMPKDEP